LVLVVGNADEVHVAAIPRRVHTVALPLSDAISSTFLDPLLQPFNSFILWRGLAACHVLCAPASPVLQGFCRSICVLCLIGRKFGDLMACFQ
jgi:hypothetical protein